MKTLVTGGAGFIGSNLVKRLLEDGHEVKVIDNESSDSHDHPHWNENADNYNLDINDYEKLKFLTKDIDVIFHLAAEARIQPAIENPRLAVQTNVLGTCNVLQAARENGVKRVVYSSTSSAYGLVNPIPNTEDMPKDCLNPYSVSKTAGEELCQMYTSLFKLETIIFRYFNVYGENQPTKGQYAPVIGLFQRQLSEGTPMTVTSDGLQRRDYTHVSDVVEANILASNVKLGKLFNMRLLGDFDEYRKVDYGEIFNIGSGTNHNILDLVKMIGGSDAKYTYIPERPGEARETLSDCTKAHCALGWKPKMKLEDWILQHEKQNT
jgi:UDP-glucose 4-epimerase